MKDLNQNYNLILFINIALLIPGLYIMAAQQIDSALIYISMFLLSIAMIPLIGIFVRDEPGLRESVAKYIKIPFTTKMGKGIFAYLTGISIPILINIIIGFFTTFSITSLSIPLYGNQITQSITSFSAATAANSMPLRIMTIVFAAGNIETLAFSFSAVLVGVILGKYIYKLVSNQKKISKGFVLGFAIVFSTILFAGAHVLNQNYVGSAFLIAAAFMLISNTSIYHFGVLLTFWIGFHQAINFMYLVELYGLGAVLGGFWSWFGAIYVFLLILMIWFLVKNWNKTDKNLFTE